VSQTLSDPGPEMPVIDETRLLAEFGGDTEILAELRDLFLEHVPPLFQAIKDSLAAGDAAAVADQAHSLKGACATYGAPRLALVCKEAELWARAGDLESVRDNLTALQAEYDQVHHAIGSLALS